MAADLAEDLGQHVRGAVHHAGLTGERGVGGHEADDLDDLGDPVQVAHQLVHRGHRVHGACPRELLGAFGGDLRAHLAGGGQGAGHEGELAGGQHEVAVPQRRDVGADRRRDGGSVDAELREAGRDGAVAPGGGRGLLRHVHAAFGRLR